MNAFADFAYDKIKEVAGKNMDYISGFISAMELKNIIQNGKQGEYLIIDLREESEYDEFHINGSVNIEYNDFMNSKDYEEILQEALNGKQIILCCERGGSSIYASRRLASYIRNRQPEYKTIGKGMYDGEKIIIKSLSGGIYGFRTIYR